MLYGHQKFNQSQTNRYKEIEIKKMSIFPSDQWNLKQELLNSEFERLDHPDYFSSSFQCPDIDAFIQEVTTAKDAIANRNTLNIFFDRLIASNHATKSVYVRSKWLVYLHRLIQMYKENSVMFKFTIRALERYTQKVDKIFRESQPYEKYFVKMLFKPYLQYLLKLTMLSMPSKDNKQKQDNNKKQNNSYSCSTVIGRSIEATHRQISSQQQGTQEDVIKWFRCYNFILSTLDSFQKKLDQFEPFLQSQLPFLSKIRQFIGKDLQKKIKHLKNTKISLEELNMTVIELNKIQNRINKFLQKSQNSIFEDQQMCKLTQIEQCTKEEVEYLMGSPLKIKGKSFQSTLSFFEDQ